MAWTEFSGRMIAATVDVVFRNARLLAASPLSDRAPGHVRRLPALQFSTRSVVTLDVRMGVKEASDMGQRCIGAATAISASVALFRNQRDR